MSIFDDISEAEYLDDCDKPREIQLSDKNSYLIAKSATVGESVKCPACKRSFIKKSYQQAFCRNKGSGNCKDRYWNQTAERMDRTLLWNQLTR